MFKTHVTNQNYEQVWFWLLSINHIPFMDNLQVSCYFPEWCITFQTVVLWDEPKSDQNV